MSAPQIKFTESRVQSSVRSSKLDIQPALPSPLPQAPLMSFDLHFDTLKDYLNNVTNIVNQQGTVLKTLIEELRTRVTITDIIEIFASIGTATPAELGKPSWSKSGDEWKDTIATAVQKIGILGDRVLDLTKFKVQTQETFLEIHSKLKTKAETIYVKNKAKKLKKVIYEEMKTRNEMLMINMKEEDDRLAAKISELEKKFAELELKTFWKLKDCEDLLKARVNEKYVADSIAGAEERIKKNLEEMNRGSLGKLEKNLKELEKDIEKLANDYGNKMKVLKDDVYDNLNKKSSLIDLENLQKDLDALSKSFKSLQEQNFSSKINELTSKLSKFEDALKGITKKLSDENLSEELESLKSLIDQLKYEIDKKADKSLIADVYSKASEPKQEQLQEKYDFNEFWKFREKTMEQLKNIENRLEKLNKSSELTNIKKALGTKANEEEVKTELSSHDFKIIEIDRVVSQHNKDLEGLLAMVKKLNLTFADFSTQSGLALLGRKQASPQICLSCGRGDTNFAPVQSHIMGRDGKVYKADSAIGKSVKHFDLEAYETGAEVFSMDTHEHAHFRRWEENEVKGSREIREVKKVPLSVVLGKESRKSSIILPTNMKPGRPQSAKTNFH